MYQFQFISLLLIICCCTVISQYAGDYCEFGTMCKRDVDCPALIEAINSRKAHGLKRCGFEGLSQLLCCPNNINRMVEDTSSLMTTLRTSQRACQKYIKEKPLAVDSQILGGQDARLGEFPHMVRIGFRSEDAPNQIRWGCGGSLITEKFVLTAAHCIYRTDMIPVRVRVGFVSENDLNMQEIEIQNTIRHPNFTRRDGFHDIGLIELRDSVKLTARAYPACLYQENDNPSDFTITGWGLTFLDADEDSEGSSILKKADIRLVDNSECERQFRRIFSVRIGEAQMCADSENHLQDTCQGDSGGPLQVKLNSNFMYNIVGITSYGLNCGGPAPGVYTKVSSYLDWIESNVWQ